MGSAKCGQCGHLLHGGDEAADRAYVQDGVSLSTGWFPLECTDVPSVEQLSKLQDALGGSGGLKPPDSWEEVKDPLVAQYFPLRDGAEKADVVKNFLSTLDASRFTIVAVERIQNVGAWQSFAVKRESVFVREKDESRRAARFERHLWHGTNIEVLEKIVQQGFNRSFCGKNATFYGKGVYFARDASYSTNKTYAVPDQNGVQHMFYVRVTVGEYCKGVKDALTPDVREGLNLYDTTVNNVADPSIFVTYHDAQAYPEYLIKFRQEGVEHMRGAYSQSAAQQPPRQQAAPPAAAGARQMMVQVPPNVAAGASMQVRAPTGQTLVVMVRPLRRGPARADERARLGVGFAVHGRERGRDLVVREVVAVLAVGRRRALARLGVGALEQALELDLVERQKRHVRRRGHGGLPELAVQDAPLAEAGPRAELHQGHELVGAARHGLVAAVLAAGPAVERADLDRLHDRDGALEHEVDVVRRVVLLDDEGPGLEVDAPHEPAQARQPALGPVAEHGHGLQAPERAALLRVLVRLHDLVVVRLPQLQQLRRRRARDAGRVPRRRAGAQRRLAEGVAHLERREVLAVLLDVRGAGDDDVEREAHLALRDDVLALVEPP